MSDLVKRLRSTATYHLPEDWYLYADTENEYRSSWRAGNCTADCGDIQDAADRIEELEAALAEATKGLDYYEECMALRKENEKLLFAQQWIAEQAREIEELKDKVDRCGVKHPQDLKATEAETPAPPSTDDQVLPQSSSLRTEVEKPHHERIPDPFDVLQADFQAHRRHTALNQQAQSERNLWLTDRLEDQERRIRTLERRMSEASPAHDAPLDCGTGRTFPTPASHGSEDKTPDPQLGDAHPTLSLVWRLRPEATDPRWLSERRSGKERRVWKSVKTDDGSYYDRESRPWRCRRKSARRKSDQPE